MKEEIKERWIHESTGMTPIEFTVQQLERQKKELLEKVENLVYSWGEKRAKGIKFDVLNDLEDIKKQLK